MNTANLALTDVSILCSIADLVPYSGVAVLYGDVQLALFYVPDAQPAIYAVSNFDPISRSNVLSRGILGDKKGDLVVASPLYKQHFSLTTGLCLENPDVCIDVYDVEILDHSVVLKR